MPPHPGIANKREGHPMPQEITSLATLADLPFDNIVDVRSPAEFAQDHIPGAINLPVLSDDERARVGTIYVRQNRFLARRIGAALVARNVAAHLEGALADRDGAWRPLVYCWRGGMRSGSFATILKQVGWRVDTIAGGYQAYRRLVVSMLYDTPFPATVVLVDGGTGTAKTHLLRHIGDAGGQVLDLEGLAAHRGSIFGPVGTAQPAQKGFESVLACQVAALDPARPVFIEAESNKIGHINLPPSLWEAMKTARVIRLTAPLEARARHLVDAYADLRADRERLETMLTALIRFHGHEQVAEWKKLAEASDWHALASGLIRLHYDPRYAHQRQSERTLIAELNLSALDEATLRETARQMLAMATT